MLKLRELLIFSSVRIATFLLITHEVFAPVRETYGSNLWLMQIMADIFAFLLLHKFGNNQTLKFLWIYNPAVPLTLYFFNPEQLLTMLMLIVFAISLIKFQHYIFAGFILGILSFIDPMYFVVIPIALVYGLGSPRYRGKLNQLVFSSAALVSLGFALTELSNSGSIYSKITKIIESDYAFEVGQHQMSSSLLVLIVAIFYVYRTERTSQNVFVIFSIMTATFLSYFQQNSPTLIFMALPAILIAVNLGTKRFILVIFVLEYLILASVLVGSITVSTLGVNTALFVYFTFFAVRVIRHGIMSGDIYKFAAAPLSIAIAGDSGVGKDTFALAAAKPFGFKFANIICGDDYHRFERQDQAWISTTHLNPRMNNLPIWKNHLINAIHRIPYSYQSYDHNTGKFQKGNVSDSSDLIVSQGLHALYPELSKHMDLTIFLKMESGLRVDLKIRRDTRTRNQDSTEIRKKIKSRESDFQQYVAIQETVADYVIIQSRTGGEIDIPNTLSVQSERHLDTIRLLIQKFIEFCGEDSVEYESLYSGVFTANTQNFTAIHVKQILKDELVDFRQMFPNETEFAGGNEGLFQALIFLHFDSIRSESHFLNYES